MSVTTILTKIALERLGYMVPIARLQTEILPKMEALAERSGYGSLSLFCKPSHKCEIPIPILCLS